MKSVFKLDRTSNRFRICPNCGKEHMVRHLGRDFCSDQCADTHYNENRRLKKQAEEIIIEKKEQAIPELSQGGPVQVLPEADHLWAENMKCNVSILDSLTINEKNGSNFWVEDLIRSGFKFGSYSTQGKLHNLPPGIHCSFLIYKNYRMYRVDFDKVLIKKFS